MKGKNLKKQTKLFFRTKRPFEHRDWKPNGSEIDVNKNVSNARENESIRRRRQRQQLAWAAGI